MTVRRQYTLPNCNLVLEGLGTDSQNPAAPMAVLMNVECHIAGAEKPLSGGREFLDSLVSAVSRYAQQRLSGVAIPRRDDETPAVEIKPDGELFHHLIVRWSEADPKGPSQPAFDSQVDDPIQAASPLDIRLSTVQLFDLIDAVDQLVSDPQTLPDLTLPLEPVPRRFVKPAEPSAKRAMPAVLGASALAAAAMALFFVPPPEFEPTGEGTAPAPTEVVPTDPPTTSDPPDPDTSTPPGPPTTDTPESAVDAESSAAAGDSFGVAPVADAETAAQLQQELTQELEQRWQPEGVPGPLSYRVTVSQQGDLLGYKYENDAALTYVDSTPLPQLTYNPLDGASPDEPVAQYRVTFTPDGAVAVEPIAASGGAVSLDAAIEQEITDGDQLQALNRELRSTLTAAWQERDLSTDATYRVRLDGDGNILGYARTDADADAAGVPLAELVEAASATAQADFQVVFTADGVVQVSPWNGWPQ